MPENGVRDERNVVEVPTALGVVVGVGEVALDPGGQLGEGSVSAEVGVRRGKAGTYIASLLVVAVLHKHVRLPCTSGHDWRWGHIMPQSLVFDACLPSSTMRQYVCSTLDAIIAASETRTTRPLAPAPTSRFGEFVA